MQLMFLLHAFSLTKYQYWEILEHKCLIVVFYRSKNSTVFVEICWKDGFFPKMGRRSMCHFLNQFFNISDGYKVSPTWPSGSSVRPSWFAEKNFTSPSQVPWKELVTTMLCWICPRTLVAFSPSPATTWRSTSGRPSYLLLWSLLVSGKFWKIDSFTLEI